VLSLKKEHGFSSLWGKIKGIASEKGQKIETSFLGKEWVNGDGM
jgi:hypothetical protein